MTNPVVFATVPPAVATGVLALAAVALWLSLRLQSRVVPHLKKVFDEYGLQLPPATKVAVRLSQSVPARWALSPPAGVALAGGGAFGAVWPTELVGELVLALTAGLVVATVALGWAVAATLVKLLRRVPECR